VSLNGHNYKACLSLQGKAPSGSNAGTTCGWDAVQSQTNDWQDIGVCNIGSSVAASSATAGSSSSITAISFAANEAGDEIIKNRSTTLRCDISGTIGDNTVQKCLDPANLHGAVMTVPGNVTRIKKDGLSICQVVKGEQVPTAIVLIMDHSGSMNTNDPTGLADEAFEDAIDSLKALDASAHAGYLSFAFGIKESLAPDLLDSTHLGNLKNIIKTNPGGGTQPSTSLKKANEWLNEPKYDTFNKAIIILGDGALNANDLDPSNTNAQNGGNIIHGVYLNKNVNDPGNSLRELTEKVSGGSFTKITSASDLGPVIKSIIQNLIQSFKPISVSLGNTDLDALGKSNVDALRLQADSSWKMPMDKDVPLQPGLNNMVLTTNYESNRGDSSATAINFQINLVRTTVNDDIALPGTVFQTSCVEWTKIRFQNKNDIDIPYLNQSYQKFKLFYQTLLEDETGGNVEVVLTTKHYQDTLVLQVPLKNIDDIKYQYWQDVVINWNKEANLTNSKLELYPVDSIFALWRHPNDNRDDAYNELLVFWNHSEPKGAYLYDVDGNGRLDSLSVAFDEELRPFSLDYMTYSFTWPNATDSVDTLTNLIFTKDLKDSTRMFALFEDANFALQTGVQDSLYGDFTLLQDNPDFSILPDSLFGEIPTIDKMSPILYQAQATLGEGRNKDTDSLHLKLSENLDSLDFANGTEYIFPLRESRSSLFGMENVLYANNNQDAIILYGIAKNEPFEFLPRDSMRLTPGIFKDPSGNKVREDHPWIEIDVALANKLIIKNMAFIYPEDLKEISQHEFTAYGLDVDLKDSIAEQDIVGVVFGPFKVNELDSGQIVEDLVWNWTIRIFDNLGQFVNEFEGSIRCEDSEFYTYGDGNCIEGEGIQFFWKWNYKSEKDQIVATGVYILVIQMTDQKKVIQKVGVKRLD
jgi:hypothetical protein